MKLSRLLLIALSTALCTAPAVSAQADPPQLLHLQARLSAAGGGPLSGPVTVVAQVHDAATGGNLLWSESETATAVAGVVSLLLGDAAVLPPGLFTSGTRWLSLQVNGDAEMLPRLRVASAPYALHAGSVAHLDAATVIPPDLITNVHIAGGAVGSSELASSAVTAGKIAAGAVTSSTIALGAVSGAAVLDGSLSNGDLSAGAAIAGTKVAPDFGAQSITTLGSIGAGTSTPASYARIESVGQDKVGLLADSALGNGIVGQAHTASSGFPLFLPIAGVYGTNDAGGDGVQGLTGGGSGAGVHGYTYTASSYGGRFVNDFGTALLATGSTGARIETDDTGGDAVYAIASAGSGPAWAVRAESASTGGSAVRAAASATSGVNYGVYGQSSSPSGYGGYFLNLAGGHGAYVQGQGLGASSAALRVHNTQSAQGMAAFLTNTSGFHTAHLENQSSSAGGGVLWLKNRAAGTFITAVDENDSWKFWVDKSGKTVTRVLQILGGSDLAEGFDVAAADDDAREVEPAPGLVVCIDPENAGRLVVSRCAYDRTVAGVISGAGGVAPGMVMGQAGTIADGEHPVALTGRVYVRCDASAGAIRPGDLLTTSDLPGHAMRVDDHSRAQGAILGKAMSALEAGQGLVLVLVTLQ